MISAESRNSTILHDVQMSAVADMTLRGRAQLTQLGVLVTACLAKVRPPKQYPSGRLPGFWAGYAIRYSPTE